MLYKKYHRNFVSQFRKGVKFRYRYNDGTRTITSNVAIKPYYDRGICMNDSKYGSWTLVFPDGQLVGNINVITETSSSNSRKELSLDGVVKNFQWIQLY